jgi:hypothetical protein
MCGGILSVNSPSVQERTTLFLLLFGSFLFFLFPLVEMVRERSMQMQEVGMRIVDENRLVIVYCLLKNYY